MKSQNQEESRLKKTLSEKERQTVLDKKIPIIHRQTENIRHVDNIRLRNKNV